jgi:hypothetical protein
MHGYLLVPGLEQVFRESSSRWHTRRDKVHTRPALFLLLRRLLRRLCPFGCNACSRPLMDRNLLLYENFIFTLLLS